MPKKDFNGPYEKNNVNKLIMKGKRREKRKETQPLNRRNGGNRGKEWLKVGHGHLKQDKGRRVFNTADSSDSSGCSS